MALVSSPCSSLETLRLYVRGELSPRVTVVVAKHEQECPTCATTCDRLRHDPD